MGYIYIIRCSETQKVYIGQTRRTISQRWQEHKSTAIKYQNWKDGLTDKKPVLCTKLCKAIYKYKVENFTISCIEEISNDLLNEREHFHITSYNSVKNGYNTDFGGETRAYSEEHLRSVNASYRHHKEKLDGLPMYCVYTKENDKEALVIRKHPRCNDKYFYIHKYNSIEDTKKAVIEYIKFLEDTDTIKTKRIKNDPSLPSGIKRAEISIGYRFCKAFNKRTYTASFTQKSSDKENRKDAFEYLNKLLAQHKMTLVIDPLDIPEKDLLDEFNDWLNEDLSDSIPISN